MIRLYRLSRLAFAAWAVGGLSLSTVSARAGWQQVWADEFNGASLSTNHWTFDTGNGFWVADPGFWVSGWGNNELECYTSRPQNVLVTNGLLHLVAQREWYSGFNYTSARLKTSGLFAKQCGRFEFLAKLPAGLGCWPALWMLPQNPTYGGWPNNGEIDVMENKGAVPTQVGGTIHFGGAGGYDVYFGQTCTLPAGDSTTNFHLYALEWKSNSIQWSVDGVTYETQNNWWSNVGTSTNKYPFPAPFDQPFYILMNLAIGGNYLGNPSVSNINANTVFPADMQVDYVRVYDWVAVPPPPALKVRFPFGDPRGTTSTPSDASGGGASLALQMLNGAGAGADYHGAANSGVAGALNGTRALDFSSNTRSGANGPLAAVTNASLAFGNVTNFTLTLWFKQDSVLPDNFGGRIFILGNSTNTDCGTANSIGMKFQDARTLWFYVNSAQATAAFASNLPTNTWIFVAMVYDGNNVLLYQGTETNPAALVATTPMPGQTVPLGSSASLQLGNRLARDRSFDGWMDDFRFYTGVGDAAFVDNLRLLAASPPVTLSLQTTATGFNLNWPLGTLQSATNVAGPWSDLSAAAAPYPVTPANPAQFYRIKLQ